VRDALEVDDQWSGWGATSMNGDNPSRTVPPHQSTANAMSPLLAVCMSVTDVVFLAYWTMSLLEVFGVIEVPPSLMYKDYDIPMVIAWNWSFFPVDVIFSMSGLCAVILARRGDRRWLPIAIISLCFTFVAGLMAIGYWVLLQEFDPSWFLPNLALVIWPLFFIPRLIHQASNPT
jgi:Family of unknown function (DUF5360)